MECEHPFVSIKGSPYARFKRALDMEKLPLVLRAATELPRLGLDDALSILVLMAREQQPRRRGGWVCKEHAAILAPIKASLDALEDVSEDYRDRSG
jgi:hypothetical protein